MTNVVEEDAAVVIGRIASLVESPTFQAIVPIVLTTFVKLETNPASAAILGAQFVAEVLPVIEANSNVLTPLVNLFAAMLQAKQPVVEPAPAPAPAEPVPVTGTIAATMGAATAAVA